MIMLKTPAELADYRRYRASLQVAPTRRRMRYYGSSTSLMQPQALYGEGIACGLCVAGQDFSGGTTGLNGFGTNPTTGFPTGQFLAVILSTVADLTVLLATSATAPIFGILRNKPVSGVAADVQINGVCKAIYGGTVVRAGLLMINGSGQFIAATSTNAVVAMAMESGASGEVHTVRLMDGPAPNPL
jgi:hypothetical protein